MASIAVGRPLLHRVSWGAQAQQKLDQAQAQLQQTPLPNRPLSPQRV